VTSPLPIAVDEDGTAAPPRRNGELVFEAPWQGRAFGMCVALLQREAKTWDDFRPFLVAALGDHPDAPYYDNFAVALDAFIDSLGLLIPLEGP
jgi:hypothetical protein